MLWISPELSGVTMPELLATIVEHLPELIAGLVFLYALITLLLSTFHLITGMRQARARLTEVATRDQLLAIFAQTGLKRLGPRIVDPAPSEGSMRDPALIRSRFGFEPARREMGRLYVDRLARRQFFTVIAGLLAVAALGWMQDYLHLGNFGVALPAGPAFVSALVLVLLFGTFGRLSIDAAAKSLLARISERPADAAPAVAYAATGEELKTAIERLAAKIEQLAERPADAAPVVAYAATGEELKTAIDRLSAQIEQLTQRPADAAPAAAYAA